MSVLIEMMKRHSLIPELAASMWSTLPHWNDGFSSLVGCLCIPVSLIF